MSELNNSQGYQDSLWGRRRGGGTGVIATSCVAVQLSVLNGNMDAYAAIESKPIYQIAVSEIC